MGDKVSVVVECYSGSTYGERPTAVVFQGVRQVVREIVDAKKTPVWKSVSVMLESGEQIDIEYDQTLDVWTMNGLT
jgi:hypothetical protein